MNYQMVVYLEAAILVVLQVMDYKTTVAAIQKGAVEKGAATRSLIERFGLKSGTTIAKLIGTAVSVGLAVVYHYSPSPLIPVVMAGVIAYYIMVVTRNRKIGKSLTGDKA